ncbi:MAG TPA: Sir2 family NAD-dependent protein deacetylase [Holophaga sp.]|nr:Sir2 family NAD-dependent protein deacetylase [Holophaga sp.]
MRIFPGRSVVILTGAGISDGGGLRADREMATPEAFQRNPRLVHCFFSERRRQLARAEPNAVHRALARLEAECPEEVLVITENVDDLHERAGSRNLVHLNGELNKVRCTACGSIHPWTGELRWDMPCPACGQRKALRPHVAWPGEAPLAPEGLRQVLARCGLFLAIGISGTAQQAESLIEEVDPFAYTVECDTEPARPASPFFEHRHGEATELVPALVEELLAGAGDWHDARIG